MNTMADFVPSAGNNGEPDKHRPRLDSSSSYVVLRETAKIKGVANPSKNNAKRTKLPRKESKTKQRTVYRGNNQSQLERGSPTCSHGLCFHRFLQFLVLFFSVAALALVVLMVTGVVGPDRCSACSQEGASPKAGKTSQQKNTSEPSSPNAFNMDLSPFYDILEELKANISSLYKEAEILMMESEGNKDALVALKTALSNTEDEIDVFYNQLYSAIDHVNDTARQFDPDHGLAFNRLRAVNATIASELAELRRTYDRHNDDIDHAIDAMNRTIAQKVAVRKLDPGPTGERGQNGSKGPPGDRGPTGPVGESGTIGPKGLKGNQGAPGNNGIPGTNGPKGLQGDQGIQGPMGDEGATGAVGDTGLQGPRGIGNFSWCQQKEKSQANLVAVSVSDTSNTKIIGAYCTSDTIGTESNLQVTQSSHKEYRCVCDGPTPLASCLLYYMECPIHAP